MIEDGHCVRTIHAEANCIVQAARHGVKIDGGDIYVTASPCWPCFRMIVNAGIRRIVFGEFYRDARILSVSGTLGIELINMEASLVGVGKNVQVQFSDFERPESKTVCHECGGTGEVPHTGFACRSCPEGTKP